jgi:hypothetical protein
VTSQRLSGLIGGVEPFELELLSEVAAVEFLLERTKNRRVNHPSHDDKARELAKELDGLALGLEQADAPGSNYLMRASFETALGIHLSMILIRGKAS